MDVINLKISKVGELAEGAADSATLAVVAGNRA